MKRFKHLFESPPGMLTPNPPSVTATEHGAKPQKKKVSEQYREEGRFKPTIPRMVKSKGVGPRPQVDSAKVKLKEDFGKPTPSVEEVAKKHNVSNDVIEKQLEIGIKVEKEHTEDSKMAREIALDHLNEKPNYYSKLKKYVEMTDVEYQSAGAGAQTLVDKPNKEPLKKLKSFKEDLRNWFKPDHPEGGWKRINSKGEAIGPCAREPGEPKPKCMSNEKRAALSKKERASAVRAKRKHDPNPERKGEPINVSNFGKGKLSEDMEQLDEKNAPTNPDLWSRAKALAKSKFDVYPSAYANGWAAKWYKSKGGGWKTVSEETINEDETPPIHVRSLYTQTYAKHGGTIQSAKSASEKAYAAVEKKHGTEMRDKLQAFHARNMNEETDTTEKVEMVQSQLHFIKYACEEILDYIEEGGEVEEWYQVKVAKSFSEFESLHAFIEGEKRRTGMVKEEADKKHPFVAVHAKKGRHETHASTSYEAAQNAAKQWKMKNTAGITVVRADKTHVAEEKEQVDEASKYAKMFDKMYAKREKEKENQAPFEGGTTISKQKAIAGKYGSGYSTARHLARQAMKKQQEKLKPVKESLQESRKSEIVKEILKKKKNETKNGSEKFQNDPIISSEITKA